MSHDAGEKQGRFNLARYFVEHRQVAWALLVSMLAWGIAGYVSMPQRKDPEIPVRIGLAVCPWPGITADRVEELVTRKLEKAAAGNSKIEKIESTSRDGVAIVKVHLHDSIADTVLQFADIGQRVTHIPDLPQGAGPVTWVSDFGDTAALMLTVASPKVGQAELRIRGKALGKEIERARATAPPAEWVSMLYCFPPTVSPSVAERAIALFTTQAMRDGTATAARPLLTDGCIGLDLATSRTERQLRSYTEAFIHERLGSTDIHPDAWGPVLIREPAEAADRLAEVAGDLYTYRQLEDFTYEIERVMQNVPIVAKVSRSGVLPERIFVDYGQERLASARLQPSSLVAALAGRNATMPGGVFDSGNRHVVVEPNVRDRSFREMEDLLIGAGGEGTPVRLRDLATLSRGYESPPRFLNYLVWRDGDGRWQRSRAITLALQMRSGEQIGQFAADVDGMLERLRRKFPPDLIIARTSDQPRQVSENVSLFMVSLYEAIFLVVVVSLVGFWNWRTAALVATSIPLTLAMSFGAMQMFGVDLQQISIASLIIALGLLVDMPVVAGDAIQRELTGGMSREMAAWLGPTRLARAIFFATLTNVVAYLPFLMLSGDKGRFLYTLPVVMTITLVAALIVSMSFIPLVALGLVRPPSKPEKPVEERRRSGFTGWYARFVTAALRRRWVALGASLLLLAGGGVLLYRAKTQFFPIDLQYLSYVDVWAPEDAPLSVTNAVAAEAERVIREEAEAFGKEHGHPDILRTLTTFVGGAGPRFWFSIEPEQQQINYAQILIEVTDKHFTRELLAPLQTALSRIPGARIDVRQLETGDPVGIPISIRVSGEDIATLRGIAADMADALRAVPIAARVRDDWGPPGLVARLVVDDDRANLSGVTRLDVAQSASAAVSGIEVGFYREGDRQIPIVARLRLEDRALLSDLSNVYVFSGANPHSVPLRQVAQVDHELAPAKIQRRNQLRTFTVSAYPLPGYLPSEVLSAARPAIDAIDAGLPPGYRMEIGGEQEEQDKGFAEMSLVMLASIALIYFALVFQFDSAVKPLVVFAAIPYGMVGALAMLAIMGQPFGFMAFLGVVSLVGVIVSHIIVLFDFIEEAHHEGLPLETALIDAGIVRLRPVMITVGATVLGLVPLAMHGGPLWEPLCYAQIGGLTVATFITLVLVPLIYTVFVRDLKLIRWDRESETQPNQPAPTPGAPREAVARDVLEEGIVMFETARPFLLALAIGLMIGIERARMQTGHRVSDPIGARTFTLLALLGAMTGYFGATSVAAILALFAGAIIVASYFRSPLGTEGQGAGVTTEVAAMATFGLGFLANSNQALAVLLAVCTILVLEMKTHIHTFAAAGMTTREITVTNFFLVIAFVVLPLLPNRSVDPWGLVNPFRLWLVFVMMTGISFGGYIAVRLLGPARGLVAGGFFAGLASSTAATLTLSQKSREAQAPIRSLAVGIVLANVGSLIAMLAIVSATSQALLPSAAAVLGAPIALGALMGVVAVRFLDRAEPGAYTLSNPLELAPTAKLAAALGIVLIVAGAAGKYFGTAGILVTALVVGATDVHAVTLAVAALVAGGSLASKEAVLALLIAFLANMVVKLSLAGFAGGRRMLLTVGPALVAMMGAAALAWFLVRGAP